MEEKIKFIQVIQSMSLRKLVEEANRLKLTKEDIISLNKSEGEFILTYYK
jgi:hypothetical protein